MCDPILIVILTITPIQKSDRTSINLKKSNQMTRILEFTFIVPPAYSVAILKLTESQYNFLKSLTVLGEITLRKEQEKKADIVKILELQETWRYSFYWVLKDYLKEWTINDFPFCTPEVKACKPFGDKRIATLRLCEKVLDKQELSGKPDSLRYENALEFVGNIWLEEKLRNLQIAHLIEPNKKLTEQGFRQEISALKNWQNPWEGISNCYHLSNLISTAIRISEPRSERESASRKKKRSNFRKEAWQPYLKAMAETLRAIRQGVTVEGADDEEVTYHFAHLRVQGDALVAPKFTQGRETQEIYAPPQKKFLSGRGRKSKIETKITLVQQGLEPVFGVLKNNFDSTREAIYSQITNNLNEENDNRTSFDQESR
jgi:hypothetical protein